MDLGLSVTVLHTLLRRMSRSICRINEEDGRTGTRMTIKEYFLGLHMTGSWIMHELILKEMEEVDKEINDYRCNYRSVLNIIYLHFVSVTEIRDNG